MKRRDFLVGMAAAGAAGALAPAWRRSAFAMAPGGRRERLDTGWRFHLGDVAGGEGAAVDDAAWERVTLPHAARLEALVTGEPGTPTAQWQGRCWYRRPLRIAEGDADKVLLLHFEGAMNVAELWLDGMPIARHQGGFLPFVVDLTGRLRPGAEHLLAVRLDNRDDPVTGPKPLAQLDFQMYHGLYRYVHLVVKDRLHITDPIHADRPASGGVFVTYPEVSAARATIRVQVHVRNAHDAPRRVRVRSTLLTTDGVTVAATTSVATTLAAGAERDIVRTMIVRAPKLWSPRAPNLHVLRTEVLGDDVVTDVEETRIGIRRIAIDREGFAINGERMFLRGTNRHQEYPYVGFAVPEAAQHRDARLIKEAGFDYIRLSHYPHAPAFMDACDELGIVVMDCIPGWQYFGKDPAFAELQYRNSREMIRRDRNHPCVILWEVSLNETEMPPEFVRRTHAIAHEEYPGDQCFTCGWVPGYDVFIRARQHGGCPPGGDHPCVVSEYGDWEYYAMTAGLDQESFQALTADESNSRQLRWHGERRLLQQATNFQEAHDDNRAGPAFADGLWVMYDYNRGYAPDIESSGCADIFRLPKYSYHFFRSQRDADERLRNAASGPMAFIASEWTPESPTDVRVFSNADEVELRLNGRAVARQKPDADRISSHLAHPPFTFRVGRFAAGTLEAVAYRRGAVVARHVVRTPGAVERMVLRLATAGRTPSRRAKDLLFAHALLQDARGTTVASAWENVAFGATGNARLVGANPFSSDAGIASILMETAAGAPTGALYALAIVRDARGAHVLAAAAALAGPARPYVVRHTLDGSPVTATSPRYVAPAADARRVRAALFVGDEPVVAIEEGTERFRVRGSTAPEKRDPFRHG